MATRAFENENDRENDPLREIRELRARLRLLEEAFETMSHGLCMLDAEGRVLLANRAYCEVIDLPRDKIVPGMTPEEQIQLGIEAGHYTPGLGKEELARLMMGNITCEEEDRVPFRRGEATIAVHPRRTPNGGYVMTFEDITARTEADNALRSNDERIRLVREATGLVDFETLPGGTAVFGPRFVEQCGLPEGTTTLTFDEWRALLHPEDRDAVVAAVQESRWQDGLCSIEFRIIRPDNGEIRWFASWGKFRRDKDGRVVGSIGVHLDITDRKRSEEDLRTSEARLSAILDAMPDCVKIFAEDGTLTYINPQGLVLLEAPSLEALIDSGHVVVPAEYFETCLNVHRRVIGGESVNWTYELVGLNGRRFHVEAKAVPFRMPDGAKVHLCISRDVSARMAAETAIRRNEERLRLIHEVTGLAEFEVDEDGGLYCSKALLEQCGLPLDTIRLDYNDWLELVHPEDREAVRNNTLQRLEHDNLTPVEFRIVRRDNGEIRWVSGRSMIERDEHGKPVRSVGAQLDITDRKRSEEALRESEERFRLAAEATGLGVWDYDPRTGRRKWSGRLIEILGFPPDVEPSLELAAELVHSADRAEFVRLLHDLRDGPGSSRFAYTCRITRANDGGERWLTVNGWRAEQTTGLSRVILTARDVTDEKTAEERIRWNATHDGLTQLANRAQFQEQLENAVKSASKSGGQFGLLMIDLDNFKQINDALGHQAGDRLLQDFADRLKSVVRAGDTVARLGGDEFAIVVPSLGDPQKLEEFAAAIHERLREPFIQNGRMLDCRISVGTAIYPEHGKRPKDLMVSADMALYAAKAAGRSTTVKYRPQLRDEVQRLASMVSAARQAVKDDRIVPFYQPQLDLAAGTIIGFEALLRWRDKKNIVHPPASIEAAFEDHEVAADISDRIIDRVIGDLRTWLNAGIEFGHVAVNASAAEFRRDDFAERVLERLHQARIPPGVFQLEVTETVFLGRGAEYVQRALGLLSDAGVKIALDDFGTGYASLRHLKQYPVDILKIDKSFVRDMSRDAGNEEIIRAVVNLGKNLGMKVVAEGIEDMDQAERLIELGCDYGQGFLFSRAVPAARVPSLVRSFGNQRGGARRLQSELAKKISAGGA